MASSVARATSQATSGSSMSGCSMSLGCTHITTAIKVYDRVSIVVMLYLPLDENQPLSTRGSALLRMFEL